MHKQFARLHRNHWDRPGGCLVTSAIASIEAVSGTSAVVGCTGVVAATFKEETDRRAICFLPRARMISSRSNRRLPRQYKQDQG